MQILLTNDDGILAPGLVAMYRELGKLGEVHVVAPQDTQSAAGHGITISAPLLTTKVTVENGFTGVAVDGRPADCVKLAVSHLVPKPPDLVVSGINSGVNVGVNVIYSGTVAAAIEAAFLGLPSVAVSLLLRSHLTPDYAVAARYARETIEMMLEAGLTAGQVASINLPALQPGEPSTGIKVCRQCTRPWVDTYERRKDPRGRDYFWNSSVFTLQESEEDTDVAAVRDGYITVTPLHFDMTHPVMLRAWQGREWKLKGAET